MIKNINSRFFLLSGLIILAVITRLIEHPANVTPILAIALFAGAMFENKKIALLIPLIAMLLSDLVLGFHLISLFVYFSFGLALLIGFYLKNKTNPGNIILATLISSILFFIITNFGSWLTDPMYQPLSVISLSNCYTLALPFFRNSILGDLAYVIVLFGSYSLANKYIPVIAKR